jgi:restriction system protein
VAIPGFQELTIPILRLAGDGKEHTLRETYDAVGAELGLTDAERNQLLPSGTQKSFENRVSWSRFYLQKAGLLEATGRGRFRITDRGQEVLKRPPKRVDIRFFQQFEDFRQFRRMKNKQADSPVPLIVEPDGRTPHELMEETYQELRQELAEQLLAQVKSSSPEFFEKLVVELLVAMGYGGSQVDAGKAVGRSGDGGIDGIIKEDKLGLDAIYIQAKRWEGSVGRPVVQAFAGSLEGFRAKKGVLITTSRFSDDARQYVGQIEKRIVLIDGEQLAQLMIDHQVGVTSRSAYTIHRIDQDYFEAGE